MQGIEKIKSLNLNRIDEFSVIHLYLKASENQRKSVLEYKGVSKARMKLLSWFLLDSLYYSYTYTIFRFAFVLGTTPTVVLPFLFYAVFLFFDKNRHDVFIKTHAMKYFAKNLIKINKNEMAKKAGIISIVTGNPQIATGMNLFNQYNDLKNKK